MNLKPEIKEFLKEHILEIKAGDWQSIYSISYKRFNNAELTETLLGAGINPLNDLTKVPDWYLRYSNVPTQITLPSNITVVGKYAFANCQNLSNVKLSDNIVRLEDRCFYQDHKLNQIDIPDTLEYIGPAVFAECDKLTSIIIPENVTTIDFHAFGGCVNLAYVQIRNSLKSTGFGLFDNCKKLKELNYFGTKSNFRSLDPQILKGSYIEKVVCIDGSLEIDRYMRS